MMRLAKLTLSGFKSFADKTEFTFDAPITGIVGPNGCGKSNVVDAIKWVLGERSAKSLRGKEMIDVIFSGSAGRQPMGAASVVLSFDNPELTDAERAVLDALRDEHQHSEPRDQDASESEEDSADAAILFDRSSQRRRALPIDTERVDVERRLYRDGTSHYLINGRKARLRDIRELFLDTGVGADAYSIIEQGKVDALLLASPYERRTFFEEAAGVARFKVRRVEAQRKLERTEVNLVRVREQLDSTERRLRLVKGQAAKARKWRQFDTELRALRTSVAFEQYDDLQQRLAGLTSRLRDLETRRTEATAELASVEDARQEAENLRHESTESHRAAEREKAAAEHRVNSAQQRRAMTERNAAESRTHLAEECRRLETVESSITALECEHAHHAAAVDDLAGMVEQAEDSLRHHAAARETAQSGLADMRFRLAERRAAAQNIDRELTGLAARLDTDQRRLQQIGEQQNKLQVRLETVDREAREATEAAAAADQAVADRRTAIGDLESEIAALLNQAESLSGDQRALASRLNEEEQQGARLDSRRATLDEMIESRVGLGDAVKAVLDRAAATNSDLEGTVPSLYSQVLAPLADLIDVAASDAPAVEAALGPALQAVVVSSITGLLSPEQLSTLSGRVTFLALDAVPQPQRDLASDESPDLSVPAPLVADLIRADERISPVVRRLLGRTYLVRDLDAAVLLASGPGAGARFVTRDGAVLDPDGRVTAGPMRGVEQGEGLLQRRSELAILESRLGELDLALARDREALAVIDARAAEINQQTASRRVALAAEQRQLVADESRRQRHEADRERAARERVGIAEDLQQTSERADTIRAEHREIEDRAFSLRRLLDEQAALARQVEQEIETAQHAADSAAERLTAARVEAGQMSEKLASARRELRRLELARDDSAQQRLRLSQSVEHREAAIGEHDRVLAECASEIAEAERQASEWATQLASLTEAMHAAAGSVASLAERVQAARQHASIIDRDWNSLEITKRELEVRRETLEQRTQEDLALDLAWEYPDFQKLIADGDVLRTDIEKAQPEIDALKDTIKSLGNVNLDAIEEELSLEGRNEELIRQVADIDAAVTQLRTLIDRLSAVSLERFKQSFETIREYFSGQNGMFRRLFGGGKAELRLMPLPETGEIDWLESGIEVMAKPPGKEPRSISQLSGGEKTMTAVALLMSIFQSKPSPFCVLDEVDAALDDANVERFAGILRQFLDRCHFIVITHNKKTMQAADQIYGVTMQERGVSRRVQVRFEHIGENGQIQIDAREGERTPEPVNGVAPIDAVKKSSLTRERLANMRRGKKAVELQPATEEVAQVEP